MLKTLKTLRKNKGLSQRALADRLGVSQQAVAKWEMKAAWPRGEKLTLLAAVLDVPIEELLQTLCKEAS